MGPLEILSKSCRKGGAGSLRSLARDALARDFCAPLALFSRNLQAGYVIVAGMRGYARKLLTLARLLASLALPLVAYGVLRSNFLAPNP